jgi:hypothetical protein
MAEIIAQAAKFRGMVRSATSCCPNPNAPTFGEHDFAALTRALAETMGCCAEYLVDAGFETTETAELAETIVEQLAA